MAKHRMTITLQTHAEEGVLRAVASGEFLLIEAQGSFLEVLDAVDRNDVNKVLIDGRQVTGNPKTIERFLYGEFAADAVAKQSTKGGARRVPQFAYVLHEPVLDPMRFGETVAVNRGMWIKVFDNLEDALEWLEVA